MKLFVCSILIFLSGTLNAQIDYFANNPEWNQASACLLDGCYDYRDFVYYLNGDTLINTETYQKCYKRGQSNQLTNATGTPCGPFTTYDELTYFVRQEGLQIYLWNGSTDALLYDFDLAVGDTIPVTYSMLDTSFVVDSIQTINIGGQLRNRFYFTDFNSSLFGDIIEGIGWPGGFFEPMDPPVNCGYQFACFSLNGQVELGSNCFFEANLIEVDPGIEIYLFPNPVSNQIEINFPKERRLIEVNFISSNGERTSLPITTIANGKFLGDINALSEGIFVVELRFENDQMVRKKIIKI